MLGKWQNKATKNPDTVPYVTTRTEYAWSCGFWTMYKNWFAGRYLSSKDKIAARFWQIARNLTKFLEYQNIATLSRNKTKLKRGSRVPGGETWKTVENVLLIPFTFKCADIAQENSGKTMPQKHVFNCFEIEFVWDDVNVSIILPLGKNCMVMIKSFHAIRNDIGILKQV